MSCRRTELHMPRNVLLYPRLLIVTTLKYSAKLQTNASGRLS